MNIIKTKMNITLIAISIWLVVASLNCFHTDIRDRSHDFVGHLTYTQILTDKGRLPFPKESWETYQPPLFYLLISKLYPKEFNTKNFHPSQAHLNATRGLCIVFGIISIVALSWLLNSISQYSLINLLVLLFISTTPKFVFMFSSYNNDALLSMLSILAITFTYKTYKENKTRDYIFLILFLTLGLYTKSTMLLYIGAINTACLISLLIANTQKSKVSIKKILKTFEAKFIIATIISLILLLPWIVNHNYKYTRELLPVNFKHQLYDFNTPKSTYESLKSIIVIPFLNYGSDTWGKARWFEPFAYPYDSETTKKYDYFLASFTTSIFGEYVFSKPDMRFYFYVFFVQLLIVLSCLLYSLSSKSKITQLSLYVILITYFIHLMTLTKFKVPIPASAMDFRYIFYLIIPKSIILTDLLNNLQLKILKYSFQIILITSIIIQIFILLTMKS